MSPYDFSEEKLAFLRTFLTYDPDTGEFKRTDGKNRKRRLKDPEATARTYKQINVNGVIYYAHILAWWFMTGGPVPEGMEIDHKDRNRRNARWGNLHAVTYSGNKANYPLRRNNTSGVAGVMWKRLERVWVADIKVERVHYPLGRFQHFKDAVRARYDAELRFFGKPLHPSILRYLEKSEVE